MIYMYMMESEGQICIICKIIKPFSDFHKCSIKKSGLDGRCKNCSLERNKKRYAELKAVGLHRYIPKYIEPPKEKTCSKCNVLKDIDWFNQDLKRKDKRSAHCKDCEREIYLKRTAAGMLERRKEIDNIIKNEPAKIIRDSKKCYKCNQVKNIDEFYHNSRSRDKHTYQCAECSRRHNLLNKNRIRENERKRHKSDVSFRLRRCVKASVLSGLKRQNKRKNGESITKYLPYTIDELKQYLESKFESWMSWENHGVYLVDKWDDSDSSTWTWQIDHIIPQIELPYDSMDCENFKKCWALENLRPLNSKINILRRYKEI